MAQNKGIDHSPITLAEIKSLWPFLALFATFVMGWASLNTQLALINQRQDVAAQSVIANSRKLDNLSDKLEETNKELVRLATIIDTAQKAGQISQKPQSGNLATLPTMTAGAQVQSSPPSAQIINSAPQEPTKKPEPTPTDSPSLPILVLPTQAPVLCVLGNCL